MIRKCLVFICLLSCASAIYSQEIPKGAVSTGEARTYSSKRTIGIVDPKAPVVFEDVTARTELKNYTQIGGDKSKNYILESTSGSVAILDFDNDGKPDIYLLNGGTIAGLQKKQKMARSALYRYLGNWKFEDVT